MWWNGTFVDLNRSDHVDPDFPKFVWEVLQKHFSSLDPNWVSAQIKFEYEAKPVWAVMNGPKSGDVDFLQAVNEFFAGILATDMNNFLAPKMKSVHWINLQNPDHKMEIINGRTQILFNYLDIGVIRNYDPAKQTFELHDMHFVECGVLDSDRGFAYEMSVSELLEQLVDDDPWGFQAVEIIYLPTKR
ncbi:MAG: hypothetical protein NTX82_04200 [Candidatus Parcubacteria bacterium]|nr:hypothetical protein [Candidatus Parcubacteria bacterium]